MANLVDYKKIVSKMNIMEVRKEKLRILKEANNKTEHADRQKIEILNQRIKQIQSEKRIPKPFGKR